MNAPATPIADSGGQNPLSSDNDRLPTVLILGGINTFARQLTCHLLGYTGLFDPLPPPTSSGDQLSDAEELRISVNKRSSAINAKFVRIVDKYSVDPATTYIDPYFKQAIKDDTRVEYLQLNLSNPEKVKQAFSPPRTTSLKSFDWVFDLTGETAWDRPEIVYAQSTYRMALSLAQHAASLADPPRAFIRITYPYYVMKSSTKGHPNGYPESSPSDGTDGMIPDGVRGRWWHETVRGVGSVKGLNTVVLRVAEPYGTGYTDGSILARLVIGHIYKFTSTDMKFLYESDLKIHTVHTLDICRAAVEAAKWIAVVGRSEAEREAGETVPCAWTLLDKSKSKQSKTTPAASDLVFAQTQGTLPTTQQVRVPLFNVVDNVNSTQETLAKVVAAVFKIKYGFHGNTFTSLVQQFAKLDWKEMIEDVNEDHMTSWSEMLAKSDPAILDTPISPYLDEHAFRKMATNFDGSKIARVLRWSPERPQVQPDLLRPIVRDFQMAKLW